MAEFIAEYWLEVLFGLFASGLLTWSRNLQKKLKTRDAKQNALEKGMIAILHNILVKECKKYLELGFIPVEESEDIIENIKTIYEAYHGIGGNGTGTAIYEKFTKLQIRKREE